MSSKIVQDLNKIASWNFSPRAVVLASDPAKASCNANYLTPAELLTHFGYISESFYPGHPKGLTLSQLYLRFFDFEEYNSTTRETFQEDIFSTIYQNRPSVQTIRKTYLDWKS